MAVDYTAVHRCGGRVDRAGRGIAGKVTQSTHTNRSFGRIQFLIANRYTHFMPTGVWPITAVILELAFKLVFIGFVLLRRRPTAATLAWIVIILAVPLVGVILYLLV